jgi:hypothetical protein
MFSTIIDFVQNKKRIEYPTSLDPFSSKDHLIRLIEGYIAEIEAFQNDENRYVISNILTYEPSVELAVINKIFSIIEMDQKIYPRMYIYLHINFNTIRDGYKLINKCNEAIRLFNEFKDRVEKMVIITALDTVTPNDFNDLKAIFDTMNPVIGCKDVSYKDEIYDFFDDNSFKFDVIVGFDDIIQSYNDTRSHADPNEELIDFDNTVSINGFIVTKSILMFINVHVVDTLLELMRSDNVTLFWMKEINDAVIKKDDYRDSWGFFNPQIPDLLRTQIEIPDNIRHSMYEYIKFLSDQLEKYALGYIPEVKGKKSTKYFSMSHLDEYLYDFNNSIKDLLYDVYTYTTLVNKSEIVLSKDKFERLLKLIDRVHGGMSHQDIVAKNLLYYNILNGSIYLNSLLKLFELMFDDENCSIPKAEIERMSNSLTLRYYINSKFDERDYYEKQLVCMIFNCKDIQDISHYLSGKIHDAN